MIDERERYERAFDLFEMPEPAFERMRRREHRRRRNQRLAAGALGVAIGGALFGALLGGIRGSGRDTGDPSPPVRTIEGTRGYHKMGFAFVLPDGWVEEGPRYPKELSLHPAGSRGSILVGEDPWAPNGSSCRPASLPNCLTSSTDLVSWLAGSTELVTTDPRSASLDGRAAVTLDVRTASGEGSAPFVVVSDWGQIGAGPHTWELRQTHGARLFFFSEEGRTLVIVLIAPREKFDAFLREAGPIVDAFDFDVGRATG